MLIPVANDGVEGRVYGIAVLLHPPNDRPTVLSYVIIMRLLCDIVKYFILYFSTFIGLVVHYWLDLGICHQLVALNKLKFGDRLGRLG